MQYHKHALALFILFSTVLTACTQTIQDPKVIADKYWQHIQSGNLSEAEKLISSDSQQAFSQHSKRISTATQLNNGEATTIISTTITTINPDNKYTYSQTFNTVLVLQQGQWKVDAKRSQIPQPLSENEEELQQFTEKFSDSMQENFESIDGAVTQGMQLLNEALQEGSKEMNDSMLNMMNELNDTMQESIDKMKQRRQQQEQKKDQQPQQNQPDPNKGEGMI